MGLDQYLIRVRNLVQMKKENGWDEIIDIRSDLARDNDDYSKPCILWYGRKFWTLHNYMFDEKKYQNGEYVEITKPMLEKMLYFATHNLDYFDSFSTVVDLCYAYYNYDKAREEGWIYVYEADW